MVYANTKTVNRQTRFTMRLPNFMYEEIKELANQNKRSIAKQIEYMLEQNLKQN